MWERSQRQNPLSMRYQNYRDNRPVLPQDRTTDWLIPRHVSHQLYYFLVRMGNKNKYLCSNNIPVQDRQTIERLVEFRKYINNVLKWAGVIPTVFLSGVIFKSVAMPYKILYPLTVYMLFKVNQRLIAGYFDHLYYENFSYFYYKYAHLAVDSLEEIRDPKRQHFRLDTDSYYRQTAQEILNAGHHGHDDHAAGHEEHHDTSTYYGPYPVKILILKIQNFFILYFPPPF
jgi:hypothetical protein